MGCIGVECFDSYGRKQHEFEAEIEDFQYQQLLLQVNDEYYMSLIYRQEKGRIVAQCGPANIIRINTNVG